MKDLILCVFQIILCTNFSNLIGQKPERMLDAVEMVDDFNLNLLDWGSSNVLAIALGNTVWLWDASNCSNSELVTIDDEDGPVTSVNWAPDGHQIAIGLNNSHVQLWDSFAKRQVLTLKNKNLINCSFFSFEYVELIIYFYFFVNADKNIQR